MNAQLQLGPQGRIVIPAAMRQALGLETGASLMATVVDGTIVLETPGKLLNQFYARFAQARMVLGESPVDELIAERRAEVQSEERAHQAWLDEQSAAETSGRAVR